MPPIRLPARWSSRTAARCRRRSRAAPSSIPLLLRRLGLKVGDTIMLGTEQVPVAAVLKSEPDALSDRLTYGPRIFVSQAVLDKTGIDQAGHAGALALCREARRRQTASEQEIKDLRARVTAELPEAGFTIADRRDPSPQVTRTLDRLRQFLTLIGLTALLVGGVGVANAVATFIDKRRKVIATMKSVGATSRTVLGDLPRAGDHRRRHRHRHRARSGYGAAARARRSLRRPGADPGRDHGVAAEHPLGCDLRASPSRCCSRCGRSGASNASAPACYSATRWRPSACGRARGSSARRCSPPRCSSALPC